MRDFLIGDKIYCATYVNTSEYGVVIKVDEFEITNVDDTQTPSILTFYDTNLCNESEVSALDVINGSLLRKNCGDLLKDYYCYAETRNDAIESLRQKTGNTLLNKIKILTKQVSLSYDSPYISSKKDEIKPPHLILIFEYCTDGDYFFDYEYFENQISEMRFVHVVKHECDENCCGELVLLLDNPSIEEKKEDIYYNALSVLDILFVSLRFSHTHYKFLIKDFMELIEGAQEHIREQKKESMKNEFETYYSSIGGNYDGTYIGISSEPY